MRPDTPHTASPADLDDPTSFLPLQGEDGRVPSMVCASPLIDAERFPASSPYKDYEIHTSALGISAPRS